MMNFLEILITAPMIPLIESILQNKGEFNQKMRSRMVVYGYLVTTGVVFNFLVLIALIKWILK